MSISVLNYVFFAFLLLFGSWIEGRSVRSAYSRIILYYSIAAAFVSLSAGIAFDMDALQRVDAAVFFARLTGVLSILSALFLLLISVGFPYESGQRALKTIIGVVITATAYIAIFTDRFIASADFSAGALRRVPGTWYWQIAAAEAAVCVLVVFVLAIRKSFFKSKIYALQANVFALSAAAALALVLACEYVFPDFLGAYWTLQVTAFTAVVVDLAFMYAVGITRLFRVATVLLRGAVVVIVTLAYTAVAGFVGYLISLLSGISVFLSAPMLFAAFFAMLWGIEWTRSLLSKLFRTHEEYAEELEKAISAIDYSTGRDEVIAAFSDALKRSIGLSVISLAIEDEEGKLKTIHSSKGNLRPAIDPASKEIDFLLNLDVSILLKTEIVTNHDFYDVKAELLAFFERFEAEAMVLFKEARHLIAVLALGEKSEGRDYTSYDFTAFSRLYARFFTVVYYLKNIARESLIKTVDRELQFSSQIIESIQENVDRIRHPKVDIDFLTKSTRKLGGDLIDLVKLSPNRYVCIVGDVSGKGLDASMSMVILKSVMRTFLKETKDFKELVVKINSFVKQNLPRGTFFAGVFMFFDFSENMMYYINCGIPVMLLYSSQYNNIMEIQGDGKVLGFVKDVSKLIRVKKIYFNPTDVMLVSTDGTIETESLSGERFGKSRITQSVFDNRGQSATRIIQYLYEDVAKFAKQELNDDVTFLAMRYLKK
jgi:hypothetical protein